MSPAATTWGTRGTAAGPQVHVDRLALRVTGLGEDAARTLARLVAEKLAAGLLSPAGAASLDSLRAEVRLEPGDPGHAEPDILAQRIADQVGRVLARDRVSGGPDAETAP